MPTHYGCIVSSISSEVYFARVYSESANRIEVLKRRVQEGRDIQAASEFCRWLLFSGLLPLLKLNSNDSGKPFKVDGAHLEWLAEDLLALCNEQAGRNAPQPCLTAGYLQSLHDKIDLVAGHVSKLSVASSVTVQRNPAPQDGSDREPMPAGLPRSGRSAMLD